MEMKKILKDYVIPIFVAIVLATIIRKFIIFQISVPSESMYPTIKIGDRIMVTRVYDKSKLDRGDIVVFESLELGIPLIKRLVGLPGDIVKVKDGKVYINDTELKESYVVFDEKYSNEFKVPQDKYLFFGDNRINSHDARKWNEPFIDEHEIMGKARFIIFPIKRFGNFISGKEALIN